MAGTDERQDEGVEAMFCTSHVEQMRGRLFFGLYVYYLSKFYELFDTVIIVLKKVRAVPTPAPGTRAVCQRRPLASLCAGAMRSHSAT